MLTKTSIDAWPLTPENPPPVRSRLTRMEFWNLE